MGRSWRFSGLSRNQWKSRFSRVFHDQRGSPTVEFVMLLPLVFACLWLIWQTGIAVVALMQTEYALQQALKQVVLTQDENRTIQQVQKSFPAASFYRLKEISVHADGQEARVKIVTEISIGIFGSKVSFDIERSESVAM